MLFAIGHLMHKIPSLEGEAKQDIFAEVGSGEEKKASAADDLPDEFAVAPSPSNFYGQSKKLKFAFKAVLDA